MNMKQSCEESRVPVFGLPSYSVSREGIVYRNESGKALAQQPNRKGYLTVNMSEGGRATRLSVHRVVLESFAGCRPEGMQALHRDGDPSNNRLENLRWGNASENEADKLLHGTKATGSRNGASRLSEEMVAEILEAKRVGGKEWGAGRLAKKFGVAVSTVVRAGRGKHWASSRAALATQPAAAHGETVAYRVIGDQGAPLTDWIDGNPGPDPVAMIVGGRYVQRAYAAMRAQGDDS